MKRKILITDTAPLYPPLWGGPKRIWGLYSNFSQELFDITYAGSAVNLGDSRKYGFNRIRNNFREILCAPPAHYHLWHAFEERMFNGLSLDLFFYLRMHTDWQFKYVLNTTDSDIVILSHPWAARCVDKRKNKFFIYDAHNCEYLLMAQILRRHALRRLILRQVYKIEGDACKKSDLILACSENEKNDLVKLYKINPAKIIIVTNGTTLRSETDPEKKKYSRERLKISANEKVIIFIGAYYKPNIDALKFVIEDVSPSLKKWKFIIVGTVCDFFKQQNLDKNIILLGKVMEEYLDLALSASDIAINPMFEGSGINIKMLDYMSYGLPIVTTQVGARGIDSNGKQPMIISDVNNFVQNIETINSDSQLYKRMSENGRDLVAERYDWKTISRKLQEVILERLKNRL